MRHLLSLVLFLLLGLSLGLSNPDTAMFSRRVAVDLSAQLARDLRLPGAAVNVLGSISQSALEEAVAARTQRRNLVVASLFTLPLPGREDIRVLGVSGQLFYLSSPY